jgi:hypothetical protein
MHTIHIFEVISNPEDFRIFSCVALRTHTLWCRLKPSSAGTRQHLFQVQPYTPEIKAANYRHGNIFLVEIA